MHGQKVWTSTAQVANKIMLLTRTTRYEDAQRPTDGITIFYTDLDRSKIEVRRIPKMGRKAVDSNAIFIDALFVPEAHRIGEEGRGFRYILDSLNPKRVLIAMEAIAIGQDALRRAAKYARERVVFDRPIGQNQGIQHPLAECWMYLESAYLMAARAADLYDRGEPCGAEANAAKFLGARAGYDACLASGADAWRLRLRQGISRRAAVARSHAHAHRANHRAAHSLVRRREGARSPEVLLNGSYSCTRANENVVFSKLE